MALTNLSCKPVGLLTCSNEAIHFKLIQSEDDFDNPEVAFKAVMSYQVFEEEIVHGYENLQIDVLFLACSLKCYCSWRSSCSSSDDKDNIVAKLSKWINIDYRDNISEFKQMLAYEHLFKPVGEIVKEFKIKLEGVTRLLQIYHCGVLDKHHYDFHKRLEAFVVFYIQGASKIVPDERWSVFTVYEIVKENEKTYHRVLGYATVYKFFAFPDKYRPRISQFLILPKYQRKGIGRQLLSTVYNYYLTDPLAVEITVEDPCIEYQNLRDVVEAEIALNLPCCSNLTLRKGFNKALIQEMKKYLKLSMVRLRRIYELIRMYWVSKEDQNQLDDYKNEVLQRLKSEFARTELVMTKTTAAFNSVLKPSHPSKLSQEALPALLEQYQVIIKRISLNTANELVSETVQTSRKRLASTDNADFSKSIKITKFTPNQERKPII